MRQQLSLVHLIYKLTYLSVQQIQANSVVHDITVVRHVPVAERKTTKRHNKWLKMLNLFDMTNHKNIHGFETIKAIRTILQMYFIYIRAAMKTALTQNILLFFIMSNIKRWFDVLEHWFNTQDLAWRGHCTISVLFGHLFNFKKRY